MKTFVENWSDENGNPAGGVASGRGFAISWQNGPLGRGAERREPNGAFVEDVLLACHERLGFYQKGKFACIENKKAINFIRAALAELDDRTTRRERAGIEGTHAEDSVEPPEAEEIEHDPKLGPMRRAYDARMDTYAARTMRGWTPTEEANDE